MNINTSKSFIHPISRQYFERVQSAGGFVSDEKTINNFVVKLSKIVHPSLWACWPLRSTQNIGTGTTAFSLGGLGNFPGTLTNGPTWGADGIIFDGSNDYISVANPLLGTAISSYTLMAVFDSDVSVSRGLIGSLNVAGTRGVTFNAGGSNLNGFTATSLYHDMTVDGTNQLTPSLGTGREFSNGNTGNPEIAMATFVSGTSGMNANSTIGGTVALSSSTVWNNNPNMYIGSRYQTVYPFLGIISLAIIFSTYVSPGNYLLIRDLIKQTLGSGLGLP